MKEGYHRPKKGKPGQGCEPGTGPNDTPDRKQVCSDCPMRDNWLAELQILSNRHESLGYGPDLASMSLSERWGLFRFLKSMEAHHGI